MILEDKKDPGVNLSNFRKKLSAVKNLLDVSTFSELNFYFAETLISNYRVLKSTLLIGRVALLWHNAKMLALLKVKCEMY